MKACLQIKQPRTSRSYFVFKIEGINLKDNSALRYIDSADNSPNRIVGLKLEKLKTKNPITIVRAVIKTAWPEL